MDSLIKSDSFEFVEGTAKEDFDSLSERVLEAEGDITALDGRLETVEETDVPLLKSNMVQIVDVLPLTGESYSYASGATVEVELPEPIVTANYASLEFEWTVNKIVPTTSPDDWSNTLVYLTAKDANNVQVPFGYGMCATGNITENAPLINHITQKLTFGSTGGGRFQVYGTVYKRQMSEWGIVDLSSVESFSGTIPATISKIAVNFYNRTISVHSISVKISGCPR